MLKESHTQYFLPFRLSNWWLLCSNRQNLPFALCCMFYNINNVHIITVLRRVENECLRKGKYAKANEVAKEIKEPGEFTSPTGCQNVLPSFIFSPATSSHHPLPHVGGDQSKQQYQEWQVAGPSWPFCSVYSHPIPCQMRPCFIYPEHASMQSCRTTNNYGEDLQGEELETHWGAFLNFSLKSIPINT